MKNWRTTILGILTIVATLAHVGILYLHNQPVSWTELSAGLTAGWGLLHASDAKAVEKN